MKTSFRKTLLSASMALPLVLAAQVGNAAMITEWGYNVTNTFTDVTSAGTTGPEVSGEGTSELVWGSGATQSSIAIDGTVTEASGLLTNLNSVQGGEFVHVNQPIPVTDRALRTFNLTSVLNLTAVAPDEHAGETFGPNSIEFNSFFTETENDGSCVRATTGTPCDDIFSLTNPELGSFNGDSYDIFGGSFAYDGFNYSVFLEISDMQSLNPEECDLIGANPGCVGFRTLEGETNRFVSQFRIEAASVPEPGSLALLGLGLAGLGLTRRRAKA